jgi:hypothetical protein
VLARDARAGRLRLPLDELAQVQVAPPALAQPPWPPALAQRLRERHRQLRSTLAAELGALAGGERAALRGLTVWAVLAAHYSRRAEHALPAARPSGDYQSPLDGWRAWRAARSGTGVRQ